MEVMKKCKILLLLLCVVVLLSACGTSDTMKLFDIEREEQEQEIVSETAENLLQEEASASEVLVKQTSLDYSRSVQDDGYHVRSNVTSMFYDAKGNLIRKNYVSATDGEVYREESAVYTYDAWGNVLTEDSDAYDTRNSYTYDTQGRVMTEEKISIFGTYYYEYQYSDDGKQMTEIMRYSEENKRENAGAPYEDGTVITTVYSYDDAGNVTLEEKTMQTESGLWYYSSTSYSYDPATNAVTYEQYSYNGASSFTLSTFYYYDEWGNELSRTCLDQDGNATNVEHDYTYDEQNRVLSDTSSGCGAFWRSSSTDGWKEHCSYDGTAESTSTVSYAYDNRGNVISELRVTEYGITLDSYSYDEKNRLILHDTGYYDLDGQCSQGRTVTIYEYGSFVPEE